MTVLHVLSDETPVGLKLFSADAVLSPLIYVFCIAYIVSFLFTPLLRAIAIHYNIIDKPDNLRKMHRTPVAYLGGIAVFMGWLCGLALTQRLGVYHAPPGVEGLHVWIPFGIVAGACVIVILGLWDDVFGIRARIKILGQVLAAATLLLSRIGRESTFMFIDPIQLRIHNMHPSFQMIAPDHWLVLLTSSIFVVALVVGCCNATNLMDGLDGLCGGVTGIIAAGFLFLAVNLAMLSGAVNANNDAVRVVLALALLGAVLGFIPYNFNPASIFMGDTGSMFLGYACAVMILLFSEGNFPKWFLAAMVMFALPILDTALAFTRRWFNHRPLFSADRHHFHHQLVARGFTVRQTVMISYGLAIVFGLLGTAIVFFRTRYAVAIYLVVFGSIIVAAYKMGMVHERVKKVTAHPIDEGVIPVPTVEAGEVIEIANPRLGAVGPAADGATQSTATASRA